MEEWSGTTGFEEEKGTWASQGLLWFNSHGYQTRHISLFDYEDFAVHGGEYLLRTFGEEVGSWQIAHTNMPLEQQRAGLLVAQGLVEKREPTVRDIQEALNDGFLVRVLVNSKRLSGQSGYEGHSILVIGYDETSFTVHNPGGVPQPNQPITYTAFENAWADPNDASKEMDAIKLTRS